MTKSDDSKPAQSEPVDWLQHQWVVAGVTASAARFVPLPFVDDAIRTQCRRFVVSRTLAASGSSLTTAELRPLYGETGSLLARSAAALAKAPFKLLLFPVRKVVAVATSVHGVPMEIMKTVLLGRTVRRKLSSRQLAQDNAATMRAAFDDAFASMDFRAFRAALADALRGARAWQRSATQSARKLISNRSASDPAMPADEQVNRTAARVEQVLQQPETARLFNEFDQRFDQAYARRVAAASR